MSIKIDFICYAIYNSSSAIKRSQAAEFRGTYPHHPNQPNHSKSFESNPFKTQPTSADSA